MRNGPLGISIDRIVSSMLDTASTDVVDIAQFRTAFAMATVQYWEDNILASRSSAPTIVGVVHSRERIGPMHCRTLIIFQRPREVNHFFQWL